MENQSNILLHPVFGDITDPTPAQSIFSNNRSTDIRTIKSRSTFVTAVATPGEQDGKQFAFKGQQPTNLNAANSEVCGFCEGKHALLDCFQFMSQPHNEKVERLKISGYCFGCLKKGHMSKDCNTRLDCQTCQRKHPTLLHIDTRTSKMFLQRFCRGNPCKTAI